jgi:hypothetical protein
MSRFRPTPTEERWSALAAALGRSSTDQFFAQRSGGWRRSALATRCALFVLGLVAAAMGYVVLSLLHLPDALACAGAAEIALAEWLILRRRLYGSGIEEALELAGLLLIGYDLLTHGVIFAHLRTSGMIAAACAVALL